jgi:zinc transport system substrate-binding protein
VNAIEAGLAELVSEDADADALADAADEYGAELDALDTRLADGLADCERRELVTSHAAFHYLADRYGLEQLAISGLTPESEPDPDRLAELADLVDQRGVTTVFHEPLAPPELAETLAREAGVETAGLDPIEGLSDEAIDDGATYVTVMDENLAALREALGCR